MFFFKNKKKRVKRYESDVYNICVDFKKNRPTQGGRLGDQKKHKKNTKNVSPKDNTNVEHAK